MVRIVSSAADIVGASWSARAGRGPGSALRATFPHWFAEPQGSSRPSLPPAGVGGRNTAAADVSGKVRSGQQPHGSERQRKSWDVAVAYVYRPQARAAARFKSPDEANRPEGPKKVER